MTRKAVMNAWKEPFVGAQASLPFQRGSLNPVISGGSWSSRTLSVL